jgi:hypothetical protein
MLKLPAALFFLSILLLGCVTENVATQAIVVNSTKTALNPVAPDVVPSPANKSSPPPKKKTPYSTFDSDKTKSDAYWRGEARPFAILEHSLSGEKLTLVIQNVEADQRAIQEISVGFGSQKTSFGSGDSPIFFSAGEKNVVKIPMPENCTESTTYGLWVNFTYGNSDMSIRNQRQIGAKELVGTCS